MIGPLYRTPEGLFPWQYQSGHLSRNNHAPHSAALPPISKNPLLLGAKLPHRRCAQITIIVVGNNPAQKNTSGDISIISNDWLAGVTQGPMGI